MIDTFFLSTAASHLPIQQATDPSLEWAKVLAAAVGGGLFVKVLDIVYQELRRKDEGKRSAKDFVDQHLDPLLKSADELVGKLHSLGKEDFVSLGTVPSGDPFSHPDFGSTVYLIGRFWAQIEILREQALYVPISADQRGRWLQSFFDCMESRSVRLIDRISQRAVGETLICESGLTTRRYIDFIKSLESIDTVRWLIPLTTMLLRATHTTQRQQLLQYTVVVHAMLDTLDPEHHVSHNRPSIPGKLSKMTWRALKYQVFGTYLGFVANPAKYIGPPKNRKATFGPTFKRR